MNLVDTEKLFMDIDVKLFPAFHQVAFLINELKEGLDDNNISVATPIKGDRRFLGEPLIEVLQKLSLFIDEYKEIKDTWHVTTA